MNVIIQKEGVFFILMQYLQKQQNLLPFENLGGIYFFRGQFQKAVDSLPILLYYITKSNILCSVKAISVKTV